MRSAAALIAIEFLLSFNVPTFSETSASSTNVDVGQAGTTLEVELSQAIDSLNVYQRTSRCRIKEALAISDKFLIPPQSELIMFISRLKAQSKPAHFRIILRFRQLVLPNGQAIPIAAVPVIKRGLLSVTRNGGQIKFDASEQLMNFEETSDFKSVSSCDKEWVVVVSGKKEQDVSLYAGDRIAVKLTEPVNLVEPSVER